MYVAFSNRTRAIILKIMDYEVDEEVAMRPAFAFVLTWAFIFVGANTISFFVLSDGYGIQRVADGIIRVGWPLLMFERGGLAFRCEFYGLSALGDLAIAAVASGAALFLWRLLRVVSGPSQNH